MDRGPGVLAVANRLEDVEQPRPNRQHSQSHEGEADGRPQPAGNDQEVRHDRNRDGEEGAAALAEERELDEGSRGGHEAAANDDGELAPDRRIRHRPEGEQVQRAGSVGVAGGCREPPLHEIGARIAR